VWTRIGIAAGLDTSTPLLEQTKIARAEAVPETKTLVMRLRPMHPVAPPARMTAPPAPISTPNIAAPSIAAPSVRPIAAPMAPMRTLSTRAVVAIGLASLLLSGLGISAARMASHRAAVENTTTASTTAVPSREELLALADVPSTDLAAAPTLATADDAVDDDAAEDDAPVVRKAPKAKSAAPHVHRHARRGASRKTPFLNNGDRFDPMNGGL
jgi:hypothetical protein